MALTINYSNPGLPVEYVLDSDPTVFGGWGGTNAELASILYRTDIPSIYRKTGPNNVDWTLQATSVGGGINVQEEGVAVPANPHSTLNFVGTGITAADAGGGVASITVPGNTIQDEGAPIAGNPHPTLNFVGTGVTATDAGAGVATLTIPGNVIEEEGAPLAGPPHPTLNFVGTGVTAANAGGGVATITIPGNVIEDLGVPVPGNPHPTLNFVGSGVAVLDGGGGVAEITIPSMGTMSFGADDIGAGADTQFIAPGTNALSFATDVHQLPVPLDCNMKNLFVRHNTANGDGDSVVYTVMKNGVATTLTATLATGAIGQASDVAHTVAFAAGERISFQGVKALAITAGTVNLQAVVQLG